MRRVAALLLLAAAILPGTGATALPRGVPLASPGRVVPGPGYYRPVPVDGMVFPVARSNFLSVLEFNDDWHAPRLRLVDGKWVLVGQHEGIDIVAERGTPIVAAAPGTVENVGWSFYSGTRVGVRGTDGRYYFYAHLSEVADGIVPGATVRAGDLLGRVGNTGYGPPGTVDEFPPHLHFGVEDASGWVSPYPMLVTLYAGAVRSGEAKEARLQRLADAGDVAGWKAAATGTYTTFGIPLP